MNVQQAKEINKLLIDDINSFLKEKFKPTSFPPKPQKYEIPKEWLFMASSIKSRYRQAGWGVNLSVELTSPPDHREYYLVFKSPES